MFTTRRDMAAAGVGALLLGGWVALTEDVSEPVADPGAAVICAEPGERDLTLGLGSRFFRAE